MRILVAEASRHGSTLAIAQALAHALQEGLPDSTVEVRAVDDTLAVAPYDAVVLGSAVYMGRWLEPARRFARRHAGELLHKPVWLFSSGPTGEMPKEGAEPHDAADIAQEVDARGHEVFLGRLDREDLGLAERAVVGVVHAPYGDFRDWPAVQAWGRRIAAELVPREQATTEHPSPA